LIKQIKLLLQLGVVQQSCYLSQRFNLLLGENTATPSKNTIALWGQVGFPSSSFNVGDKLFEFQSCGIQTAQISAWRCSRRSAQPEK
jgi:hypothetical protein